MNVSEYWIISAPGDKTCQQTWDRMNAATMKQQLSSNWKFHIPDLKVGTLDQLVGLSDDLGKWMFMRFLPKSRGVAKVKIKRARDHTIQHLMYVKFSWVYGQVQLKLSFSAKVDNYVEQVTRKTANYLSEVLEDQREKLLENLTANGMDLATYLTRFQWDMAKYPIKQSLRNLTDIISEYYCTVAVAVQVCHGLNLSRRQTARPDRERPEGQGQRLQPAQVDAAVLREEAGRLAADAQPRRPGQGGSLCPQLRVSHHARRRRPDCADERLEGQVRDAHGQSGPSVRKALNYFSLHTVTSSTASTYRIPCP